MMIMITKPHGKIKALAAAGALGLLLGVAVPLGYSALTDVGAMSLFAAGDKISAETENVTEESGEEQSAEEAAQGVEGGGGLREELHRVIFGEEPQIIRY